MFDFTLETTDIKEGDHCKSDFVSTIAPRRLPR